MLKAAPESCNDGLPAQSKQGGKAVEEQVPPAPAGGSWLVAMHTRPPQLHKTTLLTAHMSCSPSLANGMNCSVQYCGRRARAELNRCAADMRASRPSEGGRANFAAAPEA